MLSIVALSCRNPFFIDQTGWENWEVFVSISNSFLENHLGALPYENEPQSGLQSISEAIKRAQLINPLPLDGMPSDEEFLRMAHVLHFIGSNFRVAFIENPKGSAPLFTSDFPTLFFTLNQVTVPVMLLPVTPSILAVAYDARFFDVRHNWLSSEDLQRIQEFLLVQTDRAFFASATPKVELNHLREALQVRLRRSEAWVKPDVWQPVMYSYPKLFEQKGGFGFLLLKE